MSERKGVDMRNGTTGRRFVRLGAQRNGRRFKSPFLDANSIIINAHFQVRLNAAGRNQCVAIVDGCRLQDSRNCSRAL